MRELARKVRVVPMQEGRLLSGNRLAGHCRAGHFRLKSDLSTAAANLNMPPDVPPIRRIGVAAEDIPNVPEWRNWQTRWIQNPVPAREWGFDSPLWYFFLNGVLARLIYMPPSGSDSVAL